MLEHLARSAEAMSAAWCECRAPRPATPPTLTPEQVAADPRRAAPAGIRPRASGTGRSATGCCGRCWPRRGCGSARRWRCSTATGTPAWATRRSSRSCRARITRTGCGSRTAATGRSTSPTSSIASTASTCGGCATPAPMWRSAIWTRWWVFVNLAREPRFAPMRAETVAWQVRRLRRQLPRAGCRPRSRRTGCGTRTRPRC